MKQTLLVTTSECALLAHSISVSSLGKEMASLCYMLADPTGERTKSYIYEESVRSLQYVLDAAAAGVIGI
jgi:hypothetical protein